MELYSKTKKLRQARKEYKRMLKKYNDLFRKAFEDENPTADDVKTHFAFLREFLVPISLEKEAKYEVYATRDFAVKLATYYSTKFPPLSRVVAEELKKTFSEISKKLKEFRVKENKNRTIAEEIEFSFGIKGVKVKKRKIKVPKSDQNAS